MSNDEKLLKDKIFDSIFEDIIAGEYPVNAIINERALIEKYNVSKSPVREALIELCKENILRSIPRMGYQVVQISPKEISDILELRSIIEVAALKKTYTMLSDKMLDSLEKYAREAHMIANEKNIVKHWSLNTGFHLLLCSFCSNDAIYQTLSDILKFCSRGATQYFRNTWNNSEPTDGKMHMDLINALRAGNYELAEQVLLNDILAMKERFFS